MLSNSCSRRPDCAGAPPGGRASTLAWLAGCLLGVTLAASPCHAASWRDELPRAEALGEGELRWLGFRIYHATLWSEQRPFQPERPFALQLRYYRTISRQRLVQTSLDEMRRLNGDAIDAAALAQWELSLSRAFTDVADGDELIGVYAPGHGMRFYNRQHLLADIADVRLARAFFGIWLDEHTRDQHLRRKLLGGAP
ncbi:chalcone isomerase family protein [Duganella sp. LX20W]|uniref:Chalcone isomerase family protein n=1 Tax=Rugamonas brunnea TaxID=2758569 RepID=A0A7W2ETC8_9BURK|nr:chalcone isomerase family protein [Rugamonas brunnea]MBA5638258.1 chalcone isomerase family protein [Rugamonas brunnea]